MKVIDTLKQNQMIAPTSNMSETGVSEDLSLVVQEDQKQARAIMRKWSALDVPTLVQEGNLMRDYADYLTTYYRIPPHAALVIACSAISAAAGPITLTGPGRMENVPAFHTVLVTDQPAALQLAVADTFQILLNQTNSILSLRHTQAESSRSAVFTNIARLKQQAQELESQARAERKELEGSWGPEYERKLHASHMLTPPDFWAEEKDAERMKQEAQNRNFEQEMVDKPLFIVEGMAPEEILNCEEQVFDGGMFNLDAHGATWSGLLAQKPVPRSAIARKMLSGWQGASTIRNGQAGLPSMFSSLAILPSEVFGRIWTDQKITESGLRDVLMVVNGNNSSSVSLLENEKDRQEADTGRIHKFATRLTNLVIDRSMTRREGISLSTKACVEFFNFLDEVNRISAAPQLIDPAIMRNASQQVLRFALLLHLGAGKTKKQQLDSQTMAQAGRLVGWLASRSTSVVDQSTPRHGIYADEEMYAMVIRVRCKGAVTKRQLFRSYNNQSYDLLTPVLEKAINSGLLIEEGGGKVKVAS